MSLSVHVYIVGENGEMVIHDSEDDSDTLAGFESYRTELYGSDFAKRSGLTLLSTLAVSDIYATGNEVNQLKAEADVIIKEAAKFAEQANLDTDYIKKRVGNIQKACVLALKMQGNVVIW